MAYLLRQEQIRKLLADFAAVHGATLYNDRKAFLTDLREIDRAAGVRLSAPEIKAGCSAGLANATRRPRCAATGDGNAEPDPDCATPRARR